MGTITTKQLRENMSQVVRDLQNGKAVRLSYRHKVVGVIQPTQAMDVAHRRGSAQTILRTLGSINFGPTTSKVRDSNKTLKEEIRELRERDLT